MMRQMEAQEFFEEGEHVVIHVSNEVYNLKEIHLYLACKYLGML